jgi:hypothetical protein
MLRKDAQQQEPFNQSAREPQGFTVHSSGLSSEYAREQGWGLNEEERTRTPRQKQNYDGGRAYDYGPQDFGDEAVDTSSMRSNVETSKAGPIRQKRPAA